MAENEQPSNGAGWLGAALLGLAAWGIRRAVINKRGGRIGHGLQARWVETPASRRLKRERSASAYSPGVAEYSPASSAAGTSCGACGGTGQRTDSVTRQRPVTRYGDHGAETDYELTTEYELVSCSGCGGSGRA